MVLPTTRNERYEVLDALRGFALFGILMANLYSFFGYGGLTPEEIIALPTADQSVLFFIDWFIEGKFYGLFSILFGIGFGLQAQRMADRPHYFLSYWYRRMIVLVTIGLMHMVFIWIGDILTLYALLGMLLPLFLKLSDRALLRWIVCLLIAPIAMFFLVYASGDSPFWSSLTRLSAELQANLGYGDVRRFDMSISENPADVFWANALSVIPRPMSYLLSGRYPQVLGLFLIGLLFSRKLPGLVENRIKLSPAMIAAFVTGLICSFAYGWTKAVSGSYYSLTTIGAIQAIVLHVGAPLLSLGIGWAFLSAWQSQHYAGIFSQLATLGRMALSNYLFQTSLAVFLFYGYGFGLMGKLPFALLPLFAIGILAAQWLISCAWLKRHAQGPLEALWKRLAYVTPG